MIIVRQHIHIWCKVCESRLNVPEEWHTGYCVACDAAQGVKWGDVLTRIEAALADDAPKGLCKHPKRDA